jgi:hypothetical protein
MSWCSRESVLLTTITFTFGLSVLRTKEEYATTYLEPDLNIWPLALVPIFTTLGLNACELARGTFLPLTADKAKPPTNASPVVRSEDDVDDADDL